MEKTTRGRGRPALPARSVRKHRLHAAFSDVELRPVAKAIDASKMSVSDWLRAAAQEKAAMS